MEPSPGQLIELWLQALRESSSAKEEARRADDATKQREWESFSAAAQRRADVAREKLFYEHFQPAVRSRVAARLLRDTADYEDICQQALVCLTNKMEQLREQAGTNGVSRMIQTANWRAYARKVALRCLYEHIRTQSRSWRSVSGRLQYVFAKRDDLAIWQVDGQDVCGRCEWATKPATHLRRDDQRFADIASALHSPWPDIVDRAFTEVGAPVWFADLVALFHRYCRSPVEKQESCKRDGEENSWELTCFPDETELPDIHAYLKEMMEKSWRSIVNMPLDYRRALLLNLKGADGGDIQLVDYLKLASRSGIAACLEMDASELDKVWQKLPLDDNAIARMFGMERQQVINARASARRRLKRELEDWDDAI